MAVGPAQFPRDEATPDEEPKGRAHDKLAELEEARRAGTISDEDYEKEKDRLEAEERG